MMERRTAPRRRFEDAERSVRAQVARGQIDAEEARWEMLRETLRAQHAHEAWVSDGAPRRRTTDRARAS
jgi:hypothetical protein